MNFGCAAPFKSSALIYLLVFFLLGMTVAQHTERLRSAQLEAELKVVDRLNQTIRDQVGFCLVVCGVI